MGCQKSEIRDGGEGRSEMEKREERDKGPEEGVAEHPICKRQAVSGIEWADGVVYG